MARLRGWVAGIALFAVLGYFTQPLCCASADAAVTHQRSGTDGCCVIQAAMHHAAPLPATLVWNDRSPVLGPPLSRDGSVVPPITLGLSRAVERPPDRRASYHSRSARLLL
ncbi:MAG TPA: hypothetical protein VLX30_06475 [Burkholderiales bacterium]|nr:hypothetical protein [Burkholderiales bacterium]